MGYAAWQSQGQIGCPVPPKPLEHSTMEFSRTETGAKQRPKRRAVEVNVLNQWGVGGRVVVAYRIVGDEGRTEFFDALSQVELDRFFISMTPWRELVATRSRILNHPAYALQLLTVRYRDTFLLDPVNTPGGLVNYLAEQLEIADPSYVKSGSNW
ncbi:hypothetical protein GCM10011410_05100 [Hoyosella rhizosphaerae]|uniref:DUF4158 domain-containing protein n=1 Tax=Hoyosella rhizosphaerae TaxID=1755582 RepID=A0A916X9T9_9ACTN|nr:hypothetical protein GCM10011410_05100 [Hoyosella rhizosphaerae]